jgi:hypothetical protein
LRQPKNVEVTIFRLCLEDIKRFLPRAYIQFSVGRFLEEVEFADGVVNFQVDFQDDGNAPDVNFGEAHSSLRQRADTAGGGGAQVVLRG